MAKLLTCREVADWLQMNEVHIRKWARDGILRASKIGKSWRFRECDIERYLEENDNSLAGRNN